jgi:hypothetical protein
VAIATDPVKLGLGETANLLRHEPKQKASGSGLGRSIVEGTAACATQQIYG